ncbi:hypothetical protein TNCV_2817751 [Trichonephila clavipes]|nr:hypothetical protein TNCV_2817751 [Trichonephila clavipes]
MRCSRQRFYTTCPSSSLSVEVKQTIERSSSIVDLLQGADHAQCVGLRPKELAFFNTKFSPPLRTPKTRDSPHILPFCSKASPHLPQK